MFFSGGIFCNRKFRYWTRMRVQEQDRKCKILKNRFCDRLVCGMMIGKTYVQIYHMCV